MSKKNKKLNKKLKQMLHKQMIANEQKFSQTKKAEPQITIQPKTEPEVKQDQVSIEPKTSHSLTKKINPFLKYDLIKISLTIIIIAALFAGLTIFSTSSGYLDQISQKLATLIHL